MKRFVPIAVFTLAVAAAVAPAAPAAEPSVKATMATCHVAALQPERYAVFTGVMRSLRPGNRLEMRFDLFRRATDEQDFTPVDASGLGVWNRADAGVPSYRFRQRVENLPAGSSYRARVTFRWTGPAGKRRVVLRKVTKACRQPAARAGLRVAPLADARRSPARRGSRDGRLKAPVRRASAATLQGP